MTIDEKNQLLDRYVSGRPMTAAEESQVQHLLGSDAAFQEEYRLRQILLDAGIQQRRAAWEARLRTRPVPEKQPAFPMNWAAAASVILLLGLGFLWWTRAASNQPLVGQSPLFEQRDTQLGLAGNDSSVTGSVVWVVTKARVDEYDFSRLDTLRIFTTDPGQWTDRSWRITTLSEVRYRLQVGPRTYLLEQGRSVRLPLRVAQ